MQSKASGEGRRAKAGAKSQGHMAIARSGHTNRGRVKQKSHKAAHILEVGSVRLVLLFFSAPSFHRITVSDLTQPCLTFS